MNSRIVFRSLFIVCVLAYVGCSSQPKDDKADSSSLKSSVTDAETASKKEPKNKPKFVIPEEPPEPTPYNGLFTDHAPTQSKRVRAPESEIYLKTAALNRELADVTQAMFLRAVELFAEHVPPSHPKFNEAKKWMEEYFERSYQRISRSENSERFQQGLILAQDPTLAADPLFATVLSELALKTGDVKQSFIYSSTAVSNYRFSRYPSYCVLTAFQTRGFAMPTVQGQPTSDYNLEEQADALVYWLTEDLGESGTELRFVYASLKSFIHDIPPDKLNVLESVFKKLANDDRVPQWIQSTLKGDYFHLKAFQARGEGDSSTVTPQGWDEFRRLDQLAEGHFEKALKICPVFPEPTSTLIAIARDENSKKTFREWFEVARTIQFDYLEAYEAYLYTLYPRWQGDGKAMLEFGRECFDSNRFDTCIPLFFLTAMREVRDDGALSDEEWTAFFESPGTYQAILTIAEKMLENERPVARGYRRIVDRDVLKSFAFIALTKLGRLQEARELVDRLESPIAFEALTLFRIDQSQALLRSTAFAMSGEHAPQFLELHRLRNDNWPESKNLELMKKIAESAAQEVSGMYEQLYFQSVVEICSQRLDFAQGKRVEMTFEPDMRTWRSYSFEQMNVVENDKLRIDARTGFTQFGLKSDVFLGPKSIEFSVEIPFEEYTSPFCNFGVVATNRGNDPAFGTLISLYPSRYSVSFGMADRGKLLEYQLLQGNRPKSVKINVDDGYLEVFVDGRFVFRSVSPYHRPAEILRLENARGELFREVVDLSRVSVQKWTDGRPPLEDGPAALIQHYTASIERDPNNGWAWQFRGQARILAEQWDEAISDLTKALELKVPTGISGFYIGHAYEKKRDRTKALEWYKKCFDDESGMNSVMRQFHDGQKLVRNRGTCQSSSKFRYEWLTLTAPGVTPQDIEAFARSGALVQEHFGPEWLGDFFAAQKLAGIGSMDTAVQLMEKLAAEVSVDLEDLVKAQLQSYRNGKLYVQPSDADAFYLNVPIPQAFFGSIEDEGSADFRDMMGR